MIRTQCSEHFYALSLQRALQHIQISLMKSDLGWLKTRKA